MACKQCGAATTCSCQLTPEGLCSTCAWKSTAKQDIQGNIVYPVCEYNLAILQIWKLKLDKIVKDNTFHLIGLNGFQLNHYLQTLANAMSVGATTGSYCFYQDQLNPIKDIMIAISQKLNF